MSIATRVGAPRVVPTRGIPYPTGDPSLGPDDERAWRRTLLETALVALATAVDEPTVFDGSDQSDHKHQNDGTDGTDGTDGA